MYILSQSAFLPIMRVKSVLISAAMNSSNSNKATVSLPVSSPALLPRALLKQVATEPREMLKECREFKRLPRLFADSTHQAWSCLQGDAKYVLKVCAVEAVNKSSFWKGIQRLFGFDFIESLARYPEVYRQVSKMSPLTVPTLLAATSGKRDVSNEWDDETCQHESGFLLTSFLPGKVVESVSVQKNHIEQLAKHITALHHFQQTFFGPLFAPTFSVEEWQENLQEVLQLFALNTSAELADVELEIVNSVLRQVTDLKVQKFYPIMPDLRWDQFLESDEGQLCLVDLDAVVWGPRELELVLMEYLLDSSQLRLFKEIYTQSHAVPALGPVRDVYRLLLFTMNVLGETDLKKWMEHPVRFE